MKDIIKIVIRLFLNIKHLEGVAEGKGESCRNALGFKKRKIGNGRCISIGVFLAVSCIHLS